MIKGLVSIIVPVYNVDAFLPDCLLSLENQTYKDLQFVFINDGSTDNSVNLLKDFCSKHHNSKLINQPNSGVSISRNVGIKNCDGEFIYFLDSDDMIHPQTIEILVNKITELNVDLVCGNNKACKEIAFYNDISWKRINNIKVKTINKEHLVDFISGLHIGTNWSLQVKLYKASIMSKINSFPNIIPTNFSRGEDLLVNSSYLTFCNNAAVVDCVLHMWRIRRSSLTHVKVFNTKDLSVLNAHNPFLNNSISISERKAVLGNKAHQAIMLLCVMKKSNYLNLTDVEKTYNVFKQNRKYCFSLKHHPWYYIFLPLASIYLKPFVLKARRANKKN